MREDREMQVGDLVRIKNMHHSCHHIGVVTKVTILRGKPYLEVKTGDHVYRRYPSQLEAL
jgi:hypothetical protein